MQTIYKSQPRSRAIQNLPLFAGMVLLVCLSLVLIYKINSQHFQASSPILPSVQFEGEYHIGEGPWLPYTHGEHIPAPQGDITLQGKFLFYIDSENTYVDIPLSGTSLTFFLDHMGATIIEPGQPPHVCDAENPLFGHSSCGQFWSNHTFSTDGSQPITIVLHNPHRFGNTRAADTFFKNISIYNPMLFEWELESRAPIQRAFALIFVLSACLALGIAIFSFMLHIYLSTSAFLLSMIFLAAGINFFFSTVNISLWSGSSPLNTVIVGISIFLYMQLTMCLITLFTEGRAKQICRCTCMFMVFVCAALLLTPVVTDIHFYDAWIVWVTAQCIASLIISGCLAHSFRTQKTGKRYFTVFGLAVMTAFFLDVTAAVFGWWQNTLVSKYVFGILYVLTFITLLYIVPRNILAANRSRELETEKRILDAQLKENQIALMISQIQPHFLYNTLGAIRELCRQDPDEARSALDDFARYLRGNMDSLTTNSLIPFTRELDHIQTYLNLEQMRFGEMLKVVYDLQWMDFSLPPLTLQPIVENAVKHGLFHREQGGTLTVSTKTDGTSSIITIADDGIGFDPGSLAAISDGRSHIGIQNVTTRLESMANGTLSLDSTPGVGTTVTITIPFS